MNRLLKKFKRDIFAILWVVAGLFVGLSLYSYNPLDPSFNSSSTSQEVTNYCGYFGSFLSDLMYQLFGLSSWVFVLGALKISFNIFTARDLLWSKFRFVWGGILIFTIASIIGLYWPEEKIFNNNIHLSGITGLLFSSSLEKIFNTAGTSVLLWSSAVVLFVFYTEKTVYEICETIKRGSELFFGKIANILFKGLIFFYEKTRFLFKRPFRGPGVITNIGIEAEASSLNLSRETSSGRVFKLNSEEINDDEFQLDNLEEGVEETPGETESKISKLFKFKKGDSNKPGIELKKRKPLKLKKTIKTRIENWEMPKLSFLCDPPMTKETVSEKELANKARLLIEKFAQFNIGGEIKGIKPGPAVTMFEFKPSADVKISKIMDFADDLCLALCSESVRIIAPIPGRDVVGIETSNSIQSTVYLKEIIADDNFWSEDIKLPVPLGQQADGDPKIVDLRKMPHLLVAGTTGSGKSVFIVSLLTALIFRHSPKTLRLILVDPKQVDLSLFDGIPHLLMPTIKEPTKSVVALKWAIREMEKRYRSMSQFGARGLESYNEKMNALTDEQNKEHAEINSQHEQEGQINEAYYYEPQPYIVIVVEEFGDLMAVDKANVEQGVVRLAQMARAAGIHLVLAMQSPRKDVVTGLIKTNIPGRISFKVASKLDSRVILDESGGERLLARGDMLFLAPGVSKPQRHHGAWLTEDEINTVINFWSRQGEPEYDELALEALNGSGGGFSFSGDVGGDSDEEYDERYDEILSFVSTQKTVSASYLQRKFKLGYPRAARIIEVLESEGVIGASSGSKPRKVLVSSYEE